MKTRVLAVLSIFFGLIGGASAHVLNDHQHYHCHQNLMCHAHPHHGEHH
jgi:hypothetical protein